MWGSEGSAGSGRGEKKHLREHESHQLFKGCWKEEGNNLFATTRWQAQEVMGLSDSKRYEG